MTITRTQSDQSGSAKIAVGRFLDDAGTPAAAVIVCGFQPRYVRWDNTTDRIGEEWFEGMAADSALHTVAAGTRTLATSGEVTASAAGFTIAAALVLQNKQYTWLAIQ